MAGVGTWELADAMSAKAPEKRRTALATVTRTEADGTVWAEIDGGAGEFPATSTAAVSPGDVVTVAIEGGRATVTGNATDPAASTSRVDTTERKADAAQASAAVARAAAESAVTDAQRAYEAADAAQQSADSAATAAGAAQGSADAAATAAATANEKAAQAIADAATAQGAATAAQGSADAAAAAASVADGKAVAAGQAASAAQASADHANRYANAALDQLGVVQDVAGVLSWASEQGAFVETEDTAIVDGKVYFTLDGTDYTPVVEPDAAHLADYWELDMSGARQAMNEYILAHLAVTQRGLWVLPSGIGQASDEQHAPGYKMLLSSNGSYLYDSNGVLVRSDTASGTDFSAGRDWHVGGDDAYIFYDASEGTIVIGGSSVQLGSTKTLSELVNEVDNSVVFKVTDDYSQDGSTVTLTAHVYQGGADIASRYPDSSFAWSRKNEDGSPEVPLGNGRTITVSRSTVGYGAAIKCKFTPPNDSALLTESDDSLTSQEGEPLTARTPSGNYVRVADLSVETSVFDADRVMVVGNEDEHLVSIATLKDAFGGGDYERLTSKPSIEGVTLSGNKTFPELGIFKTDAQGYDVADDYTLTTMDINRLWANAQPVG